MLKNLLTILAAITKALAAYFRTQEQKRHEQEQQDIKQDPAGWMDDHFNGNANGLPANKPVPGNAAEADKAKPAEPDQKP